jgi:predicted kinase
VSELEQLTAAAAFAVAAAWTERQCAALQPVMRARYAAGAHRDCHGDMHLENLVVLDGKVTAFDALEFDPALRASDRMSETAFVTMDLLAHGRADIAYPFLTRYLEAGGDYDGLAVLRFYLVQRALVRAKVRTLKAVRDHAPSLHDYIGLAADLTAPREPVLVLMHGLSGSGKTSVSSRLLRRLPAVRVRSDIERKRLLGLDGTARTRSPVGGGAYAGDVSRRTYARLHAIAATALAHGFDVVVDAAFLDPEPRAPYDALAHDRGARFCIVDCTAPVEELRRRIAARGGAARDESEADTAVLDWQLAHGAPLAGKELENTIRVDTHCDIDDAALFERLPARRG